MSREMPSTFYFLHLEETYFEERCVIGIKHNHGITGQWFHEPLSIFDCPPERLCVRTLGHAR